MRNYNIDFQAFRREWLHRLSNMDPDDIICELSIDTDTLMDRLWEEIEEYIARAYDEDDDLGDDCEEDYLIE